MSSCDRSYGIAGYPECSGNGECLNSVCVCREGWTSIGDFALDQGYDCDIHILTIKLIALAYIVISLPALYLELKSLWTIFSTSRFQASDKFIIIVFVHTLSGYFRSILKLIDPVKYVMDGSILSSLSTVLFVYTINEATSFKFSYVISFFEGSMRVQQNRESIRPIISISKRVFMLVPSFTLIVSTIIFLVGIYSLNHEHSFEIGLAYDIVIVFNFVIMLLMGTILFRLLITSFKQHLMSVHSSESNKTSKTENINSVEKGIKKAYTHYYSLLYPASFCIFFYIIDASWYFFRRKFSYTAHILGLTSNVSFYFILAKESKEPRPFDQIIGTSSIIGSVKLFSNFSQRVSGRKKIQLSSSNGNQSIHSTYGQTVREIVSAKNNNIVATQITPKKLVVSTRSSKSAKSGNCVIASPSIPEECVSSPNVHNNRFGPFSAMWYSQSQKRVTPSLNSARIVQVQSYRSCKVHDNSISLRRDIEANT